MLKPNPSQQLAISGPWPKGSPKLRVVLAGPGSGKTFTLTDCIKHYAATDLIVVMTFTNGAAYEMRARLGELSERLVYLGTTHSYCFKLIQQYGHLIGYRSGHVAILPDGERIPRLLAVRDRLGKKISQEKLTGERRVGPLISTGELATIILIHQEYEFTLKSNNLVDYNGILRDGARLLELPEVAEREKVDFLFVDERQDSSADDQLIYDRIQAEHKFLCGDPDQAVFEFRGADPQGFVALTKVKGAQVIKLEQNYRSDIVICRAANNLIRHNKMRVDKEIVPVSGEKGYVEVAEYETAWTELEYLVRNLRGQRPRLPQSYSVGILFRMNYDAEQARRYLHGEGLPVAMPQQFRRPPDWERALLILSLLVSPDNEILAERYLKLDNPPAVVDRWILEARAGGRDLMRQVKPEGFGSWNFPMGPYRILAENRVSEGTINLIASRARLLPHESGVSDLIQDLYAHEDWKEQPSSDDLIHVGTMHSAKGREWDVVFLPAFEQYIIPHLKFGTNGEIEEERRLAFVAVTRARHELYISWATSRTRKWGQSTEAIPSQFIKEMDISACQDV